MVMSAGEMEHVGGEPVDDGHLEDGSETLEDLLRKRPQLVSLLDHRAVVERQPGDWLYQEGEEITRFAYVVVGRVRIIAAGEVAGEVKAQELLGLDEFLLRDENPKYVKASQAVEPTFLFWLDEGGLRRIADMDQGAIKAFMRLQARIQRELEKAVRRVRREKESLEGTAARLRLALGHTQDELTKASRLPHVSPPPPPRRTVPLDLPGKLQQARDVNLNLARLINSRANSLEELLVKLRRVIENHPKWVKEPEFARFLQEMIELVERDARREIVLPP
jgi:CRP-like cAMP-binding protein